MTERAIASRPEWADRLIIYEIATPNFATGDEPESGSFTSVSERLPYLADLGINAVWLSGHNWAHDAHFYNIWTQYAVYRPDRIEPLLGTEEDLKALVERAHEHGIRIFLDCITHGVMSDSPLVAEHPEWFSGGSWGMTDYDWFGGHEALDRFWVDTWLHYVLDIGVDGFRLDVAMYRPDLWAEIKRRAAERGREIVVFHEHGPGGPGAVDFLQRDVVVKENTEQLDKWKPALRDLPATLQASVAQPALEFCVQAATADGTEYATDRADNPLRVERSVREIEEGDGYRRHWIVMDISGFPPEPPASMVVHGAGHRWDLDDTVHADSALQVAVDRNSAGAPDDEAHGEAAPGLRLRFLEKRAPGEPISVQLSSHDTGWEGYPPTSNPYAAQGSRFLIGYACLLAPAIPIFMAGEEFAADFVPNPKLTPGLFGAGEPGTGTWLYGSWIRWDQLEVPVHAEMLEDVRALLALRRRYSELMRPLVRGSEQNHFHRLAGYAPQTLPVPYAYTEGARTLLVAGNPSAERRRLSVELSAALCPARFDAHRLSISSLWGYASCSNSPESSSGAAGLQLEIDIPADGERGGGVAVIKIESEERKS